MTRLSELLPPATRAQLAELSRDLDSSRTAELRTNRAPSYVATAPRGGATRADMLSELHLRAAMTGEQLGGAVRYSWQRCEDNAGTFYRCRVTRWGRYDVNSSRTVLANTLPALWDSLADRGLLPRDVWCEDDAFLAFLMCGRVGQLAPRERVPFTATAQPEQWQRYSPRLARGANGELLQLARIHRDDRVRWGYVPRDPKHGDSA